jgi:uncharacterized PurR-regulated membrane protein YhhQ (DUF165 family)
MGWITRRIAGYVTFAIVSSILTAIALARGWMTGGLSVMTTTGAVIVGIAFLVSLAVTSRMKGKENAQKAWEQYSRAWQDYYARMGYYRQR